MSTAVEEEVEAPVVEEPKPKKKGLFSRFRNKKKQQKQKAEEDKREDEEEEAPNTEREPSEPELKEEDKVEEQAQDEEPKEEEQPKEGEPAAPTFDEHEKKPMSRKSKPKKQKVIKERPTARESAFEGPPRYDWIDIETAAAVKVQSIARRNKVMDNLEKQGKSTAAMRNRSRRRNARRGLQSSEDAPSALACCGIGLLFGDATQEEDDARRALEKEKYFEKKRTKAVREEELRLAYHKTMAQRRQNQRKGQVAVEGLEVIDD